MGATQPLAYAERRLMRVLAITVFILLQGCAVSNIWWYNPSTQEVYLNAFASEDEIWKALDEIGGLRSGRCLHRSSKQSPPVRFGRAYRSSRQYYPAAPYQDGCDPTTNIVAMSGRSVLRFGLCEDPELVRESLASYLQTPREELLGSRLPPDPPKLPYQHAGPNVENYMYYKTKD